MSDQAPADLAAVLATHATWGFNGTETACACDHSWRRDPEHRAHVADALADAWRAREAAVLRDFARRCHNGAGDPWQAFYDAGLSPVLDRMADALARAEAVRRGESS